MSIDQLKADMDYEQRMWDYNCRVRELEFEKKRFIETNPDFPKELTDIMFLNVIAPPQRIKIIEI